jgi:uncharacterized repeat protein (TIGR03803 family)
MMKLNAWKMVCAVCAFCFATVINNSAQTFTSLASFDQANGASPDSSLVQGPNGKFYGTTHEGGYTTLCPYSHGCGTVYEVSATGRVTTIYNFCSRSGCTDGQAPSGVIVGPNGHLYGTTSDVAVSRFGTVFEITPSGRLITLYTFCTQNDCSNGIYPQAKLAVGTDGNLYGSTPSGGAHGGGTVFEITPAGVLTTIYNFCSLPNCSDGQFPSALVLGWDGNFYGTAANSRGKIPFGNVFRITPAGQLTVLHRFCSESKCADGGKPFGGLVPGPNGEFYGTTSSGGANELSCFRGGCGTVFEIARSGQFTTLYSFCSQSNCSDGEWPVAAPIVDAKGNLYGTSDFGGNSLQCGASGCGTAFKITRTGQFISLHSFCSQSECSDGELPVASLLLATNGNLYGTTAYGGTASDCPDGPPITGCGTVFVLSKAAKPFVQTLLGFGIVGAEVELLGNNLTGATSVSFNGISATFTVKSATMISADVPTGATSGYVTVTTANGTLKTNVPFRVIQ